MDSRSASFAIRLLRTGIVPASAVDALSVGYSRVRGDLSRNLESFIYGKQQDPQFVQGEWGSGKSHFLSYCRMLAGDVGLPVACISLNASTVALNHPQRIYGELAAALSVGRICGLRAVMNSLLTNADIRKRLLAFACGHSDPLAWSVAQLCELYADGDCANARAEIFWSFVLGEDLGWADYAYKREQALRRIEALAACLQAANGAGLLLLLDEVETLDQLWNYRSRMVAYKVIARLTKVPGLWTVCAITNRFTRIASFDMSRINGVPGQQEARAFLSGIESGRYMVLDPPRLDRERAVRLAGAVAALYQEAYPQVNMSEAQLVRCVEEWSRNPSKNPRRLIRIVVNQLDLLRPLRAH